MAAELAPAAAIPMHIDMPEHVAQLNFLHALFVSQIKI